MNIDLNKYFFNKNKSQAFSDFLNGLDFFSRSDIVSNERELSNIEYKFSCTNIPKYFLIDRIRSGDKADVIDFSKNDGKILYLRKILGHKINERLFFEYPRLCVLYSLCILNDRWKDAERYIVNDGVACYFYAKYCIGGFLPEKMHNQIVLNSFLGKSFIFQKYFSEIGCLQRKKMC